MILKRTITLGDQRITYEADLAGVEPPAGVNMVYVIDPDYKGGHLPARVCRTWEAADLKGAVFVASVTID